MPFPFLVSQKDPDSVRPPFKSITRRKNPKPQPDEASQIRSGNTIRFTPDVQHQPPVQPEPEPTPELTPEATPSTTAEPIRRQLQNTIVEINPSFIPPNAEAPPSHPKPSIADIIRASKKRITIAVLAGVALGMAGNVAYYYHSTGKNPNQNIDKAFE